MQWLIVLIVGFFIYTGCSNPEEDYDSGYSDGYAEGYNTQCQIRSTLVAGDWDNADYSRGYNDGRNDGVNACQADRR